MCAEITGRRDKGTSPNGLLGEYYKVRILNAGLVREFCNWETFSAQCKPGDVIVMTNARYGRMKFGRCIRRTMDADTKELLDVGCSEDIIK